MCYFSYRYPINGPETLRLFPRTWSECQFEYDPYCGALEQVFNGAKISNALWDTLSASQIKSFVE